VIASYFYGIFWGVFVIAAVSTNDNFAYFVGRSFGKTSLISLSPNKTLEGFLGGAFFTVLWCCCTVRIAFSYDWLVCTVDRLQFEPFAPINCAPEINSAYTPSNYEIFGYEI
jgi:phosphatidate cytidylyltransferase